MSVYRLQISITIQYPQKNMHQLTDKYLSDQLGLNVHSTNYLPEPNRVVREISRSLDAVPDFFFFSNTDTSGHVTLKEVEVTRALFPFIS